MSDLTKQQQTVIETVARRFSATLEKGNDSADAYFVVAGKRIAVDITNLKRRVPDNAAKPRLRFDKVVTRLIERLQASLGETVPNGMTVLLTVTAPIRLPSKTAGALEDKIQTLLDRRSLARDEKGAIHRNCIRIRLLRNKSAPAPKLIGFVHNSDSDPAPLLDMTHEFLELISTEAGRRAKRPTRDRWLVVTSARGSSFLEAYRYIYSHLRMATGLKKILMVFADGRVEPLTE